MPSPPFPSPDSDALRVILEDTMKSYDDGEVDVRGAILHAAVHGWYEGHIEGEDACPVITEERLVEASFGRSGSGTH